MRGEPLLLRRYGSLDEPPKVVLLGVLGRRLQGPIRRVPLGPWDAIQLATTVTSRLVAGVVDLESYIVPVLLESILLHVGQVLNRVVLP